VSQRKEIEGRYIGSEVKRKDEVDGGKGSRIGKRVGRKSIIEETQTKKI
jgi:hypothetical protein